MSKLFEGVDVKRMQEMAGIKPIIYIIRGGSGSGKTTLANEMKQKFGIQYVEADQHMENTGGYDPKKLQAAHAYCKQAVDSAVNSGKNIIVSNTSIKLWEVTNVLKGLEIDNVVVIIVNLYKEGERADYKDAHNLTPEYLERQKKNFEDFPSAAQKNKTANKVLGPDLKTYFAVPSCVSYILSY